MLGKIKSFTGTTGTTATKDFIYRNEGISNLAGATRCGSVSLKFRGFIFFCNFYFFCFLSFFLPFFLSHSRRLFRLFDSNWIRFTTPIALRMLPSKNEKKRKKKKGKWNKRAQFERNLYSVPLFLFFSFFLSQSEYKRNIRSFTQYCFFQNSDIVFLCINRLNSFVIANKIVLIDLIYCWDF